MRHLVSIPLKLKIFIVAAALCLFAGIAWVLYQQATFLHDTGVGSGADAPPDEFILPDSLMYLDYVIVRTLEAQDSTYGVAIFKNKERVWTSRERTVRPEYNEVKLVSLRQDGARQLFVQHFSGGAHCCWTSILLELSDTVHTVFNSDDYADFGYELTMSDLDRDGIMDLHLTITTFDYFDRLNHAASPFSSAYFSYSPSTRTFVPANRRFSGLLLKDIAKYERRVTVMADTTDFITFEDLRGDYLAHVLKVLIEYVFAGEKEKGWKFFDAWYRLADKDDIKHKVQQAFEASTVYRELYPE